MNEYDSVVNMSTIRIVVQEVSEYTKEPVKPVTLGDQLKQGLADSWHSVVNFFRGILILFVCFVPFLLIIAPMLLVIYLIYRKNKKQNKKKDEQLQAKSDEEHKDE